MKKGIIKLQIRDVWEFLDKPHRVISDIRTQVERLPTGKYESLNFDEDTKKELLDRLSKIRQTGKLSY